MEQGRRFSAAAIVLMILLIIRLVSQIAVLFISPFVSFNYIIIAMAVLYLLALVGVILKSKWALILVIIIAVIDIILSVAFMEMTPAFVGAVVVDLVLLFLAISILRRV